MNLQQVIDAAMQIATGMGVDGHNSPVIDSEMTAEDLLPIVFRHVYHEILLANPMREQDLIEAHTITVLNGVGVLPPNILTEYMHMAFLPEFPYSSLAKFHDYSRQKFSNMLCYWTYNNGQFFTTCEPEGWQSEEGSGSEAAEGVDGEIVLHAVTIPALPTNATDEIDINERELNALIHALALAVRGELKIIT